MANVRICDRCGKTLRRPNSWNIYKTAYRYNLFGEMQDTCSDYDLCPNCMTDFEKFMEGPSEGETAERKE